MLNRTLRPLPLTRRPGPVGAPRVPWGWAVLGGTLGLLMALATFAPARWAAAAVSQGTGGRLVLDSPSGTVWDGSARWIFTGGVGSRDAATLPSPVSWQLRPHAAGLRLALFAPCCTPQPLVVWLQPRWAGVAVQVADGPPSHWPAALLAGLGTPWNTVQIEGELQLTTRGLSLQWVNQRLQVAGQAQLSALRVASRLSTLRPMGSYRLTLAGGPAPALQLETLEGSLRLSGTGQWVGSRLRFTGEASAAPEREAALANLLNLLGARRGARSLITIG